MLPVDVQLTIAKAAVALLFAYLAIGAICLIVILLGGIARIVMMAVVLTLPAKPPIHLFPVLAPRRSGGGATTLADHRSTAAPMLPTPRKYRDPAR